MQTTFDDADYRPDKRLALAVMSKNIKLVRVLLSAELNDAKFNHDDLLNTLAYVTEQLPETFEPYTADRPIDAMRDDPNTWDRPYFMRQQIQLQNNFAFDRFEHLIEVRSTLKIPHPPEQEQTSRTEPGSPHAEAATIANDTAEPGTPAEQQAAPATAPTTSPNHDDTKDDEAAKPRNKVLMWIILLILFAIGAWFTLSK